jgi:hypothetical protein
MTLAPIDSVFITRIEVDGATRDLHGVIAGNHTQGVEPRGDTLCCAVPCAFGSSDEGRWGITLSARGYPEQTIEFNARFGVFHGGCPSFNDQGVKVSFRLSRLRPATDARIRSR